MEFLFSQERPGIEFLPLQERLGGVVLIRPTSYNYPWEGENKHHSFPFRLIVMPESPQGLSGIQLKKFGPRPTQYICG